MAKTFNMRALMTLPAFGERDEIKRGALFEASAQERLDLLQAGRAEDVVAVKGTREKAAPGDGE